MPNVTFPSLHEKSVKKKSPSHLNMILVNSKSVITGANPSIISLISTSGHRLTSNQPKRPYLHISSHLLLENSDDNSATTEYVMHSKWAGYPFASGNLGVIFVNVDRGAAWGDILRYFGGGECTERENHHDEVGY